MLLLGIIWIFLKWNAFRKGKTRALNHPANNFLCLIISPDQSFGGGEGGIEILQLRNWLPGVQTLNKQEIEKKEERRETRGGDERRACLM